MVILQPYLNSVVFVQRHITRDEPSRFRQLCAFLAAQKKRRTHLLFEQLNAPGERGLRDCERTRGLGDALVIGDCEQRLEKQKIHRANLSLMAAARNENGRPAIAHPLATHKGWAHRASTTG